MAITGEPIGAVYTCLIAVVVLLFIPDLADYLYLSLCRRCVYLVLLCRLNAKLDGKHIA